MLLRSLCKNLKTYNNPFWDFINGGTISAQAMTLGCAGYETWLRRLYKRNNLPKIVAYLSLLSWLHARTSLGPNRLIALQ